MEALRLWGPLIAYVGPVLAIVIGWAYFRGMNDDTRGEWYLLMVIAPLWPLVAISLPLLGLMLLADWAGSKRRER